MANRGTITPPLQPILKRLRTRSSIIDLSIAYTREGNLTGEVAFRNAVNGSWGRLNERQMAPLLSFVERNGLRPLVVELARTGTAVRY